MKKNIRLALALLAALLLAGCELPHPPSDMSGEAISGEAITPQSKDPSKARPENNQTDPNLPPQDGMKRSLLTNEWVDEAIVETRPIAVIIPNEVHAVPHCNLSEASILYEARVEGNMTRMMAIYEDWQSIKKIGNVRSVRSYFVYWALEWDSIIVHYGGPYFVYDLLNEETTEHVDGMYDTAAFYRSADRDAPHNAYTSGAAIIAACKKSDISLSYRGLTEPEHFLFAEPGTTNTLSQYGDAVVDGSYVDMTASYPLTRCYFQYNDRDGLYYRYQYLSGDTDGPHVDGVTGEQLSFSNLLVQRVKQEEIGNGYLAMQCHDTTRDGYFFTKGKGIHVTWKKEGDYGATKFYDDNGEEIQLNDGKTMILIIRDTDNFTYR